MAKLIGGGMNTGRQERHNPNHLLLLKYGQAMLHWTKDERRFLIVLSILLLSVTTGSIVYWWWFDKENIPSIDTEQKKAFLQFQEEAEKLTAQDRNRADSSDLQSAGLFPFDPNHADSLTLRKLGLPAWQIGNLMKYRRKGGVWRSPDDFARLYGLTPKEFERLRPYIRIQSADARRHYATPESRSPTSRENAVPNQPRQEKYAEGTRLPLNAADTTQLKGIPGIGSYKARKIVDYRERLGGFVSPTQLEEIEDMPPGLERWFVADGASPRRIAINRATFKQLVRHPYLSYEQTRTIVNHIRKYGPLRSWRELRLYPEFSEKDFQRLEPYFSFD